MNILPALYSSRVKCHETGLTAKASRFYEIPQMDNNLKQELFP